MVIKFATFDPVQDPDNFNPAFPPTPSSSPSATLCQPCKSTYTFTRTIVGRLAAAGASLVLRAPAFEIDGHEIRDRSAEMPLHRIKSDVRPEFHRRQLKEFILKELKVATQNFSHKNIIGRGGFGKVYKVQLADGSLVAIKRMKEERSQGALLQFETEVMTGCIIPSHHNLLPVLRFCKNSKPTEFLLVYPFLINISLKSCLSKRNDNQHLLDWPTRIKIAAGAARGLSHLHDFNIVHRDIKAANIMLDGEFEPHIGDFGLAKLIDFCVDHIEEAPVLPRNESKAGSNSEVCDVTTELRSTIGHIAPKYLCARKCLVKTDVFAFGIMLLELVTGQKAFDPGRLAVMLLDWVKRLLVERRSDILVDPNLQGEYDQEDIEKMIQLALLCTQSVPRERPSMAQVVRILEGHSTKKRWEEYQTREPNWQLKRCSDWIVADSTSHLRAEELSEPREFICRYNNPAHSK